MSDNVNARYEYLKSLLDTDRISDIQRKELVAILKKLKENKKED